MEICIQAIVDSQFFLPSVLGADFHDGLMKMETFPALGSLFELFGSPGGLHQRPAAE